MYVGGEKERLLNCMLAAPDTEIAEILLSLAPAPYLNMVVNARRRWAEAMIKEANGG